MLFISLRQTSICYEIHEELNGKLSESAVIKINTPHDRVKIITLYLDTALELHSFLLESTMNAACQFY